MNDYTVAILIAVLGVVAGFVTAFFAEPVKIYFQNRVKLMDIKKALYKEMYLNYVYADMLSRRESLHNKGDNPEDRYNRICRIANSQIKTNVYQEIIKNEISLFYRLPEANYIHMIYGVLSRWTYPVKDDDNFYDCSADNIMSVMYDYSSDFQRNIANGFFDKKLFQKIIGKKAVGTMVSDYESM